MNSKTYKLCLTAIFTALTFVITRFIQIPIPLGYFNIGNCIILLACSMLPSPSGLVIGSVGSALADLTSYPVYTIPTLIIKFLMPLIYYRICRTNIAKSHTHIVAAAIATLIPLFGYTAVGCIIYSGFYAGLAQFPGLLLEYAANLIIFTVLYRPITRIKH